jgi:predicted metal-dependent peptidase
MASAAPTPTYDYAELDKLLDKTKSQVFLGNNAAFLGPMMCATEFEWNTSIETADTDGKRIRWNPADFLGCTILGRISSLLHELAHIYRLHALRRGDRCPDVWNIACDIAINRDLLKFGYKLEWPVAGIGAHPEIPFELEEQIYDYLKKPGGGGTSGIPGHVCGGLPLNPSQATKQHMINSVVQSIQAAQQAGKPGDVPGSVKEIINTFLAPKVPWETIIYKWMDDLSDEDYTWQRPARNHLPHGMYLPTRYTEQNRLRHIMCFQDVSGSIGEKDSIRFNSELKFLWETFKPGEITMVQFDTKIQKVDKLEAGDEFGEIEIIGRGGTSLVCVKKYILDHKPSAVIIFSDMEVSPMTSPAPDCPILWVCVGNKSATVPYGQLVHVDA